MISQLNQPIAETPRSGPLQMRLCDLALACLAAVLSLQVMSPTLTHRGLSANQPHFRLNGRKRRGFVILPLTLAISARSKHSEKDQTAIRNYDQQVIIAESKTHQRVEICRFFPENVRKDEYTPAQLFADDISETTDNQYRCLANTTVQSKTIPTKTSICHGACVLYSSHSPISLKLGFLVPHNLKYIETDSTPSTKRELRTLSLSSHRAINLNHHLVYPTSTLSKQQEDCCLLYTSPSPRDKRQSRMPSSA